ncbi:MAG: hypothetical protein KDB79_09255 [Acidobacteria bacterium]|nr:hypothetical protein [Acidobacteriota bacterium]
MFFIDGVGIGERNEYNPLAQAEGLEPLNNFLGENKDIFLGGILVPTDTRLGVDGRPQSASGQTAIYTGLNAPQLNGGHKHGFPNEKLREIIKESSIFLQLKKMGIEDSVFVNAYVSKLLGKRPRWKSATTCAVEAADMKFRTLPDLLGRKAIFHDFTNRSLIEYGLDVPEFSPVDAAEILADIASGHRFTLYEHFITDKIGHDQDLKRAQTHLPELAEFIRQTLCRIDFRRTTFILTSDHGNIENLSIRNHTLNNVPTIIWGRKSREIADQISDLTHITPAITKLLST